MSTDIAFKRPKASRRELVIFSPYPPAKSGIADYTAELMPYLSAEFDITLVVSDEAPLPAEPELRILLASEFRKHRKYFSAAPKLYHVGNNPQHCYMFDFLRQDPGVVVLHDFNLLYLHEMATQRWGDRDSQCRAMEAEYGGLGRDLIIWQMQNSYRERFAASEVPLNGDILEGATAVITHSRQVQYRVAARVPTRPVWYVPHHLAPRSERYFTLSKQAARAQIGLPQDEIIVTALGFVTRAKQIALTLECLAALEGDVPSFRFVLAGEKRAAEYDVDADIASCGLQDRVTCTDYLDEDLFFKHVVAADTVVNLRYPGGGEMSGSLIRALGLGAPTVIADYGPMAELPDNIVRKVHWAEDRRESLTRILRELMREPAVRYELGKRAAQYIRREHAAEKSAGLYARILREAPSLAAPHPVRACFPAPRVLAANLRQTGPEAKKLLERSAARICWTVPAIPMGQEPDDAALVISTEPAAATALLASVFDWKPDSVRSVSLADFLGPSPQDRAGDPLLKNFFSAVLAIVPSDLDETSAALLMRRLNAAMRRGGSICMELFADAGDEVVPLAPLTKENLEQRLRDSGFSSVHDWQPQEGYILDLVSGPVETPANRISCCMSACKASDFAVWRYSGDADGTPMRWGSRNDT